MTAVDISPTFIAAAQEPEKARPLDIRHLVASAGELPFPDSRFDFAAAIMSLMDMPEANCAISEVHRVLISRYEVVSVVHRTGFRRVCREGAAGTKLDAEIRWHGSHIRRTVSRPEQYLSGL